MAIIFFYSTIISVAAATVFFLSKSSLVISNVGESCTDLYPGVRGGGGDKLQLIVVENLT
jgi:hypothetical protein